VNPVHPVKKGLSPQNTHILPAHPVNPVHPVQEIPLLESFALHTFILSILFILSKNPSL
jgi:hypothetical protein